MTTNRPTMHIDSARLEIFNHFQHCVVLRFLASSRDFIRRHLMRVFAGVVRMLGEVFLRVLNVDFGDVAARLGELGGHFVVDDLGFAQLLGVG